MKKIIFSLAVMLTGTMAFASTGEYSSSESRTSNFGPGPCTVTVTKYCKGTGTNVNSTRTSTDGKCEEAFMAADQGWATECKNAMIKKIIAEEIAAGN